jgi:hypothetical protein
VGWAAGYGGMVAEGPEGGTSGWEEVEGPRVGESLGSRGWGWTVRCGAVRNVYTMVEK